MSFRIIAGKFKGRLLKTPKGPKTRPTQGMLREAVFNICQNEIENARFLDLYAGSGAISFEALSRGAAHATLIENDRQAIACIKANSRALKIEQQVTLIPLDVLSGLKRLSVSFNLVYIDPPYDTVVDPIIDALLTHQLLNSEAMLFIEERYNPKKTSEPFISSSLSLKDSRRFGIALLHQYRFCGT